MATRDNAFCVAVTGHRPNRMPVAQWGRITRELAQVMTDLAAAHPGRKPLLLSGLAEGADRLAAFVALGLGWSLHAILAFHRSRFEADFSDPFAVGEFRALLRASDKVEEPKRDAHLSKAPEDGYHAVGQRLLALGDVLIAVWDGEGSRGKGGTVDVMSKARAEGTAVIWIHAKKAQPPRRLEPLKHNKNTPRTIKKLGSRRSVERLKAAAG